MQSDLGGKTEPAYYKPLGALVANFNLFELRLEIAILMLLGGRHLQFDKHTGEQLHVMLEQIKSVDARIDLFSHLAFLRFGDKRTRERIRRLVRRMERANRQRNDIIHGRWHSHNIPAWATRFQSQAREPNWREVHMTPASIRKDAERVRRIAFALDRFSATTILKHNGRVRLAQMLATLLEIGGVRSRARSQGSQGHPSQARAHPRRSSPK